MKLKKQQLTVARVLSSITPRAREKLRRGGPIDATRAGGEDLLLS